MSWYWWVLVGLAVPGFVLIFVRLDRWADKGLAREMQEKQKRQQEVRKRKRVRIENLLTPLLQKEFVVYIRRRDGGRITFESVFTGKMASKKIQVTALSETETRALAEGVFTMLKRGTLAVVGCAWEQEHDGEFVGESKTRTHLDYRLIDGSGRILVSGHDQQVSNQEIKLASRVMLKIGKALLQEKAV